MFDAILGAVIGSILGGLVTGLFTVYIFKQTVRVEEERRKQDKIEKYTRLKPELEISGYKNYLEENEYVNQDDIDLDVFVCAILDVKVGLGITIVYDQEAADVNQWVSVVYRFRNIGKTDIEAIYVTSSSQKNTAVFKCIGDRVATSIKHGMLDYCATYDKKVRVGDKFSVRINYLKNRVIGSSLSASLGIILEDANNNFWRQPLFAPIESIYHSQQITYKEFRSEVNPADAIACFKDPMLW